MSYLRIFSVIVFLHFFSGCKTGNTEKHASINKASFRILGYYHSRGNWSVQEINHQINKLTDLNLAFINPDSNGKFAMYPNLGDFIKTVQERKVRVFLSIGGGSSPIYMARLMQASKRSAFIAEIKSFMLQHGFDGVDVDLENNLINADYGSFVEELADAVKGSNKLLSAAVARWNADKISDATLDLYDFLNIMSYDKTGPWRPETPGQHAPFSMAETDFQYFRQTRNIPAEKILIGLPFYGYGFGKGAPESMTYAAIVSTYDGAASKDEISLPDNAMLYYNGVSTIRKKTRYALAQKAGGVMIWQIRGDADGKHSLLNTIYSVKSK